MNFLHTTNISVCEEVTDARIHFELRRTSSFSGTLSATERNKLQKSKSANDLTTEHLPHIKGTQCKPEEAFPIFSFDAAKRFDNLKFQVKEPSFGANINENKCAELTSGMFNHVLNYKMI